MNKSRKILRWLSMLCAVVFMMTMGASALAASFQAKINSSSARVYKVPSTSSKTYVSGGKGITVTVTATSGSWARVSYNGNIGYTKVSNLNLKNRIKAYTAKSTPVYRQASSSSSRMGTLSIGRAVYVVGKSGSYYRVQNASGSVTGYVRSGNLTTKAKLTAAYKAYKKAQAAGSSSSSGSSSSTETATGGGSSTNTGSMSKADYIIYKAKQLVGADYAHSDNPPSSFNCSSFVEYCLEKFGGYSVPGTSASQAEHGTMIQDYDDLKKADILCFDTDGDGECDHTGLFIDKNSFIEASEGAGKVRVKAMDQYYREFFMYGRRP